MINTGNNTVSNTILVGTGAQAFGQFIQPVGQPVVPAGTSPTALIITPQGRLTLSSTAVVMTTDMTSQTTIYYLPYIGATIPIYNGAQFVNYLLSTSGVLLALDSNSGDTGYQQAGYLYDIFAFINSGVITLGTGPAWTNSTTRSNAISQLSGLWVNSATITLRFGNASGNTTSVPAYEATYLGTMYASANGQTQFNIKPAATGGGSTNIIGIYNAYNQKRMSSTCRDSASYSYGTASWRKMDNSAYNSVSFVDGLGQTNIAASLQVIAGIGAAGYGFQIGVNLNSTTATPDFIPVQVSPTGTAADNYLVCSVRESFGPTLGFNYIQAMENAVSGITVNFNTQAPGMSLVVDLEY